MRVAVIGAGVSGCVAARMLATRHEVTLFEASPTPGGHAKTVDVEIGGRSVPVDVAFMVFNQRTYPNFCRLLDWLGVESRASDMSFSVCDPARDFEYQGGGLRGLFAQKSNALSPGFWRMLADIVRFNRSGLQAAQRGSLGEMTVGEFLAAGGYSRRLVDDYLAPMAAAIWSSSPGAILDYPAGFLIGFFANHGLLQLTDRPQWRTICGGSRRYVEKLLATDRIDLAAGDAVVRVQRSAASLLVERDSGGADAFDQVVFAGHADQVLDVFCDVSDEAAGVLRALPYQTNQAVLHSDESMLPRRRDAWASWNYRLLGDADQPATLTYDLGRLQGEVPPGRLLLSLNDPTGVDPSLVHARYEFAHPAYSGESVAAQRRWAEVSGRGGVHFCGAYWGFGFHEDGVNSAIAVAGRFGIELEECIAASTKAPSPIAAASR